MRNLSIKKLYKTIFIEDGLELYYNNRIIMHMFIHHSSWGVNVLLQQKPNEMGICHYFFQVFHLCIRVKYSLKLFYVTKKLFNGLQIPIHRGDYKIFYCRKYPLHRSEVLSHQSYQGVHI